MRQSILKLCILAIIVLAGSVRSNCQEPSPDVFKEGTITEQLNYLEEHTRIYENFRAIREDMFRTISKNTVDTLKKSKTRINSLIAHTTTLNSRIDSLRRAQETINNELKNLTRSKNSISILGLEVNKATYNTVMWAITGILVLLLLAGYLTFRQNRVITLRTKKDLNELKEQFEKYQTKTRLDREKMAIDHFNEMKRLKSGLPNRGS